MADRRTLLGRIRVFLPRSKTARLAILLVMAFGLGYWWRGSSIPSPHQSSENAAAKNQRAETWTCSMHPQIRQPRPGKCPICGMDLIAIADQGGDESAGVRELTISDAAKQLMSVQTSLVERRFASYEVRMVGKVDYDETRLADIAAWVAGRIDRLYIDYTGIEVRQGDHMVSLYSPDLLVAQDELHRAARALRNLNSSAPEVLRQTAQATVTAARERLRRWGLTDSQIEGVEKEGLSSDHVTINAPVSGTVIERNGQEGMYVETGTSIYRIADLSSVWVKLDAYESDLPWLRYGQRVTFEAEAIPGEELEGRIAFIDPILNKVTRTAKVRVNVTNADGRLKPEMFVRAVVRADVSASGRVMDPSLAGKWICPMHPEVVRDASASCDVCGMALVRAESLGYKAVEPSDADMPLLIPASAPLITGKRAVVYVEVPAAERPTYEGREVILGPRAGDVYVVKNGLQEGERVVTSGNFKIDSALQIQAKSSMMLPAEERRPSHVMGSEEEMNREGKVFAAEGKPLDDDPDQARDKAETVTAQTPKPFREQLRRVVDGAAVLSESLASDDFASAKQAVKNVRQALAEVDMGLLRGEEHDLWMEQAPGLSKSLATMETGEDIESVRLPMDELTAALVQAVTAFGIVPGDPIYHAHCPMALKGKGGDWLQSGQKIRNPYFGASMLDCGEILGPIDDGAGAEVGLADNPAQRGHEGSHQHRGP